MNTYTVSFFGHRDFVYTKFYEEKIQKLLKQMLSEHEYVEFLVGRNGEFDSFISSNIRMVKKEYYSENSAHVLVLAYPVAEFVNNEESFYEYYDEIEISTDASQAYFKEAIKIRNREMIDRSDMVIVYVENNAGGAYEALEYALKNGKKIVNLAVFETERHAGRSLRSDEIFCREQPMCCSAKLQ